MVQANYDTATWWALTPDPTGSYINGTWSTLAAMSENRLYFGSNVLPNYKVFVLGGEYSGPSLTANWTNTGEIYNIATNTWSPVMNFPQSEFGDDPTTLISGDHILAGYLSGPQTYVYSISGNSWTATGTKLYSDQSDEEGYTIIPNGNVLDYSLFHSISTSGAYAQMYVNATGTWQSISPSDGGASGTIPQLSSVALGYELGPQLRLQDGRVLFIGATQHTALYNPATNTWAAGPDTMGVLSGNPAAFGADDAPAAELPNGHVIFAADAGPTSGIFSAPTQIFDFNPVGNTTSAVSPAPPAALQSVLTSDAAYVVRMLSLPTGQILLGTPDTSTLWVYTGSGTVSNVTLLPVITSVVYTGTPGVFTMTGRSLNGQSAGSAYGDDVVTDENYPVVSMRNSSGTVYYCTTTNWSSVTVGVGSTAFETVTVTLNPGITAGNYLVTVHGAGLSSIPFALTITSGEINVAGVH